MATKRVTTKKRGIAKRGHGLTIPQKFELDEKIRYLHVLNAVSLKEIAAQTGYNIETVRTAWSRVKVELLEALQHEFKGDAFIAKFLSRKEKRVQELSTLSKSAEKEADRINAIRAANQIDESSVTLMQDAGFATRAPKSAVILSVNIPLTPDDAEKTIGRLLQTDVLE